MTFKNIIYIQSDNHARAYAGCYGHPSAITPTLDGLARRGVRYANAYSASALCCPSRASIATGRYPHQTGYWDNVLVYDGRVPSWMRRVRDGGANVTGIGKLHFRSGEDDNGFSAEIEAMHIHGGVGQLVSLLRCEGREPPTSAQWRVYMEQSGVGDSDYQDYDRLITERAIRWLCEQAPRLRVPWVLLVSYASPHPPFTVPERFRAMYRGRDIALPRGFLPAECSEHPAVQHLRRQKGYLPFDNPDALREVVACYLALVTFMDEQAGLVLAAAEAGGLLDETLVIYTSDHGEALGAHGLLGKSTLFEESVGVPLILAGPGLPAGLVVERPVSHVDLYPTILDAVGVPRAPGDDGLPGRSLLADAAGAGKDRPIFAEYHGTGSSAGSFMVRAGRYKLIHHVGAPPQLFDLVADPDECVDLAADLDYAAERTRLERALHGFCDPEATDRRAKADQMRRVLEHGGSEAVLRRGTFVRSPPPGVAAQFEHAGQ